MLPHENDETNTTRTGQKERDTHTTHTHTHTQSHTTTLRNHVNADCSSAREYAHRASLTGFMAAISATAAAKTSAKPAMVAAKAAGSVACADSTSPWLAATSSLPPLVEVEPGVDRSSSRLDLANTAWAMAPWTPANTSLVTPNDARDAASLPDALTVMATPAAVFTFAT